MRKLFGKTLIFALAVCLSLVLVSCGDEPTVQISEDGYWVIDGEKTDVKAEGEKGEKGDKGDVGAQGSKGDTGTQGEDGKTPDFKIENGELKVSYDGGNTWTSLGTVKGEDGEDLTFTDDNPQGLDFYLKDDGTYSVGIGNAIYLSEITIPSTYNGRAVTEIGVFCPDEVQNSIGSQLKKINIPTSVTTIGEDAFKGCDSLTSIVIPDGVTTIGEDTFKGCKSLTSIVIPDGVTTIGEYAFSTCYSLTNIVIPDGVTTIGKHAFRECTSLTSVTIGNSVTSIGEYAFYYCPSLTSVTIPDSVTTIGEYAFGACESLTDVYYTGSELEWWTDIIIQPGNFFNVADIHYNYTGE